MSKREMTDSLERPGFLKEVKVVLVGPAKCGKTALIQRFVNGIFSDNYVPTGFEKYSTKNKIGDYTIDYSIWDTSGSGSYDTVRPLAYQDANVFILCFNISEPKSLDLTISKWLPEIRSHSSSIPIILCGCKADIRHNISSSNHHQHYPLHQHHHIETTTTKSSTSTATTTTTLYMNQTENDGCITKEQAYITCQHIGAICYIETCSKYSNSTAINDVFKMAAEAALGISSQFGNTTHHNNLKSGKNITKKRKVHSNKLATSLSTSQTKCQISSQTNRIPISSNHTTIKNLNNCNGKKPQIKSEIRKSTKNCSIM